MRRPLRTNALAPSDRPASGASVKSDVCLCALHRQHGDACLHTRIRTDTHARKYTNARARARHVRTLRRTRVRLRAQARTHDFPT
eukprot:6207857-Pleurochrysis_carterae.AAC.2